MKLQEEDKCTVCVPHLRLCHRKICLIERNKELFKIYIFFRSLFFFLRSILSHYQKKPDQKFVVQYRCWGTVFFHSTHAHTYRDSLQRHFQCSDAYWNCEVEKGVFFPVNKTLFTRSAAFSHTVTLYRQCHTQWWTVVCYFRFCFIIITDYYAFICHLAGN